MTNPIDKEQPTNQFKLFIISLSLDLKKIKNNAVITLMIMVLKKTLDRVYS